MNFSDKIEPKRIRYEELNQLLAQPDVLADPSRVQAYMKEHARLAEVLAAFDAYASLYTAMEEAKALLEEEDEMASLAREEEKRLTPLLEEAEAALRTLLVPEDPEDSRNVIMEIRAGTGGEEAALFGMDLFRMYTRFAENMGWKTEVMSFSDTGIGGLKEAVLLITGDRVNRYLKYESGVHRVQRVPVTESSGRIHTSAATVAVLPEAEEVDIVIEQKDLIIETHRSSGAGGQHVNKTESAVRMVHIPTGIVVTCQDEKSQIKNREKAMKVLRARVLDYYKSAAEAIYTENRKSQVGSGDRSERIRTYNFPQGRVTDHRIGLTLYNLPDVLEGDLTELSEALILASHTEKEG